MSTTTFASGTQPTFQQTTAFNGMLLWHCDSVTRREECKCPWVARSMSAEDRDKKNTLCAIESYEMEDLIAGLCVTVNCTSVALTPLLLTPPHPSSSHLYTPPPHPSSPLLLTPPPHTSTPPPPHPSSPLTPPHPSTPPPPHPSSPLTPPHPSSPLTPPHTSTPPPPHPSSPLTPPHPSTPPPPHPSSHLYTTSSSPLTPPHHLLLTPHLTPLLTPPHTTLNHLLLTPPHPSTPPPPHPSSPLFLTPPHTPPTPLHPSSSPLLLHPSPHLTHLLTPSSSPHPSPPHLSSPLCSSPSPPHLLPSPPHPPFLIPPTPLLLTLSSSSPTLSSSPSPPHPPPSSPPHPLLLISPPPLSSSPHPSPPHPLLLISSYPLLLTLSSSPSPTHLPPTPLLLSPPPPLLTLSSSSPPHPSPPHPLLLISPHPSPPHLLPTPLLLTLSSSSPPTPLLLISPPPLSSSSPTLLSSSPSPPHLLPSSPPHPLLLISYPPLLLTLSSSSPTLLSSSPSPTHLPPTPLLLSPPLSSSPSPPHPLLLISSYPLLLTLSYSSPPHPSPLLPTPPPSSPSPPHLLPTPLLLTLSSSSPPTPLLLISPPPLSSSSPTLLSSSPSPPHPLPSSPPHPLLLISYPPLLLTLSSSSPPTPLLLTLFSSSPPTPLLLTLSSSSPPTPLLLTLSSSSPPNPSPPHPLLLIPYPTLLTLSSSLPPHPSPPPLPSPLLLTLSSLCPTLLSSSGVLQRRRGCAVSSDGSLFLYDRWGLRGEDFLSFDPEGLRWAELSPLASPVAQLWEGQRHMKEEFRSFLLNECQPSLQRLIQEWRAQNNTQEKTDVHVFARAGPGPGVVSLVCHVTHTESSGLLVQLTRDGVALRDRGNMLGPRPNGDGTFQQRLTADITADITGDHTAAYQCDVQTKRKHIFVKWDGRTGGVSSVRPPDSSCCSCAFQVLKFLPWALLCLLMGSLPVLLICSAKLAGVPRIFPAASVCLCGPQQGMEVVFPASSLLLLSVCVGLSRAWRWCSPHLPCCFCLSVWASAGHGGPQQGMEGLSRAWRWCSVCLCGPQQGMEVVFCLSVWASAGHGEGYTLEFQHTVHWGPDGTLHFHQTTVFEGKPIFYCNSTTLTDQPRQHWIREACGPDELNSRHEYCKKQYSAHKQWFQDIDQTIGGTAKILQRRGGCSVGVSGAIVFDAWGLNGGDFLAFEHEGLTWTPVSELASSVALKWNKEHSCSSNAVREDDHYTHFSQQVCEKFGHEIQSWYKETDQTGVRIQLTKNGVPLHSGVKLIGPCPNGDGTNQMRVQAQISLSDTKGYRCNVHRRSFDFSVLWDGLAGDASGLMRALLYCFAVLVAVLLYMAVMQTIWQSD
ncbi:hypothetical protein ACEWY4_022695 [Coilia grayii]|uniref:MHC class I-like antigen recognition-like domain-containing protein n=1 Tax=Coilia grayii TaxID=363190 RepID=A0ABD1J120_9TELE